MMSAPGLAPTDVRLKAARRVFIITLALNLLVSLGKLFWGYHSHTLSMIADGFHSLLDALANVVGVISLGFSMKPADHDHPYGHRKFEAIASILIAVFIFMTCFEIAQATVQRLWSAHAEPAPSVSAPGYLIMLGTLLINGAVTLYERKKGRELGNDLLSADAQHTLSDCLVSLSVVGSMAAVQLGFSWADPLLALLVALIILKVGLDMLRIHFSALTDEAVLDPAEVHELVLAVPGVLDCHKIRSRGMRDHVFIDLHIQVNPTLTVKQAHEISYAVEAHLEAAYQGRVNDVLVHIEEYEADGHHAGH